MKLSPSPLYRSIFSSQTHITVFLLLFSPVWQIHWIFLSKHFPQLHLSFHKCLAFLLNAWLSSLTTYFVNSITARRASQSHPVPSSHICRQKLWARWKRLKCRIHVFIYTVVSNLSLSKRLVKTISTCTFRYALLERCLCFFKSSFIGLCWQHFCVQVYEYMKRSDCGCWCCQFWRGLTRTRRLSAFLKMCYIFQHHIFIPGPRRV